MTSWFKTRNQSKHMYKVHRHIDMKHVVIDIYKQNSSTLFFFFFSRWVTHCWAMSKQVTATWKQKLSKAKNFQYWTTYSFFPFFWGTKEVNRNKHFFLALKKSNLKFIWALPNLLTMVLSPFATLLSSASDKLFGDKKKILTQSALVHFRWKKVPECLFHSSLLRAF